MELCHPWVRRELQVELHELALDDPRPAWEEALSQGLVAGIDEVFHFFFDDHNFDESHIGVALLDQEEVAAICGVKSALQRLLDELGDVGDDAFVSHPEWTSVTSTARHALEILSSNQ